VDRCSFDEELTRDSSFTSSSSLSSLPIWPGVLSKLLLATNEFLSFSSLKKTFFRKRRRGEEGDSSGEKKEEEREMCFPPEIMETDGGARSLRTRRFLNMRIKQGKEGESGLMDCQPA